jgi:DHA1 family bicyclomycin/chloramphenicol resistance-like MFS transporter
MRHAYVIALGILSYLVATDIYTPSMPDIARDFNTTSDEVQKTISYFLLGAVLSCVFSGIFADQFGKKKFLMAGMALAAFGSVLTVFCPTIEWLILGRFLQGLGGAVGPVIGFAAVQELYKEDQAAKIFGLLGMATAGVPAAVPMLGGLISTYFGWSVIFVIIFFLFIFSFVCIWLYLPASLNHPATHSGWEIVKSYREILTSRTFLALALLSPLFNSVEWFYLTFLPFYVRDIIGLSAELYGFYIGVLIAWFAIGSYLGSRLITTFGVHKTIMIGLYLGLFSGVMLWLTVFITPLSILSIYGSLSFFLLGFGILFPSSVNSSLRVFTKAKTRASSIRSLFITGFAFMGSYTAEWVDESQLSGLALFVTTSAILSIWVYSFRKQNPV